MELHETNIKEIITRLSLDQKLALLTGKDGWTTVAVESLGIPSITVSDGPHGLRQVEQIVDGREVIRKAVCFPTSAAMAATWNPSLVCQVGKALGEECQANEVDILLGPGTNIKRTPLCGRNFEYFSEDPLLAGELAAAYIEGVQSTGVGTSLKHFATNNQETDRHQISTEVDIRALREIYLKPFEIAVKKARPWTVMCAYNRLHGIYCSENQFLLNDVLKEEWGFQGIVVSDWGAVYDRAKALKASLELEMPFKDRSVANLKEAYQNGEINNADIDTALERLLRIVFYAARNRQKRVKVYEADRHHTLAKQAALEAITLLKNETQALPVQKNQVKKLAVIGGLAENPVIQGGGSAHVQTDKVESPLFWIKELAGEEIQVDYFPAYMSGQPAIAELNQAIAGAQTADMALVFAGNRNGIESESYDRAAITLLPEMEQTIIKVAAQNPNTVVVIQAGSAVDMTAWIDKVKAVVFNWYAGQAGGSALAEILFGMANPCGKIAETFPLRLEDNPAYATYPGNGHASWYAEGIMVGYRYYDSYHKEVLFPFGHGLSYTNFDYRDLKIIPESAAENDEVTVSFMVRNSGKMPGKEIVQLYVRDRVCKVLRPDKELKGFKKVELQPGEEQPVEMKLDRTAFAYFNSSLNKWHVESGEFEIIVGASSRDIRLAGSVTIRGENDFS